MSVVVVLGMHWNYLLFYDLHSCGTIYIIDDMLRHRPSRAAEGIYNNKGNDKSSFFTIILI